MVTTAIILLSHGSRLPEAQVTLNSYRVMIAGSGLYDLVEAASLQFNKPDLEEAVAAAVAKGAGRVIVAPIFLYRGVHIQHDIPEIVAAMNERYPGLEFLLAGSIGADQRLAEIIIDRIKEVI